MSTILYGNLRVEIVSNVGARIQRVSFRQAAADLLHPRQPGALRKPLMRDREQQVADGFAAIQARLPAGFYAACGYGKTTLLQNIAATASERGIAPNCIYLRADGDRVADLLQDLVAKLYESDQPVKPTPQECAQLLGQVSAVVAVDDLRASPDQVRYLLDVLSGCGLVMGSAQPVLGRRGSSWKLDGLPEQSALALLAGDLGRPLTAEELAAARHLVAAVDGQPLHLRQCAALAREGRHSLRSLARQAVHDPEVLDRLSIDALARHERRALAVLALAAGTLLPTAVVDAIGQIAYLAEWLESLHRRGLAEQCDDRFGLPVCKAESYRHMLLKDLDLAAAARGLSSWLTAADPTAAESQSAAEAALAMIEFAAGRGDWTTVLRLARAAERVLFLAGRWEAWHHALGQGLDAARASGDRAAEAFFTHQQGTLAFCQDQLQDAHRLLQQALTLREQIGDTDGASITRHNLRLLELPDPPSPPRSRVPRRALHALGGVLGTLALVVATVAITGALRSGVPAQGQPTGPPSTSATHATGSASSLSHPSSSSPSQPGQQSSSSAALISQAISFTSSPPSAGVVGDTYAVTASGGGSGNPVILSIDPGSASVCSITGSSVTFNNPGSCVIDANQAGTAKYQAAPPAQQTITVNGTKIAQSITFTSVPRSEVEYNVTATGGGSGNPVTFSIDPSSTSSACSISGSLVTFGQPGSCVIDANQAGTAKYQAAPQAQQTIRVNGTKIAQSITFTSVPRSEVEYNVTATGGGSGNPVTFSIDPSSTSSACSISGSLVTFGQPGSCVIDANQAGNDKYQAAPQAQQTITVTAAQSIVFHAPSTGWEGMHATLSATGGGSGNPVVFSVDPKTVPGVCNVSGANGTTVNYTGAAPDSACVIDANQAGNTEYQPAPQAQQTITVNPLQ